MDQRHFLFLQGLPGPSFRLIGQRLDALGQRTSHVAMNGGDLADRNWQAVAYRGGVMGFGAWLERYCQANAVTDLVLFGEKRPLHMAAIETARRLALDVHVFEEGYLRPNSVTVENWWQGLPWQPPRSLAECAARHLAEEAELGVPNLFGRRLRESIVYWVWAVLLFPLFPRYRSHRPVNPAREAAQWIARTLRRRGEQARSRAALAALGAARFYLFPLQLDGDAQVDHRSPFGGIGEAIDTVLASFARAAPTDTHLVVKRHPFDPDPLCWERIVAAVAARHAVADRVHYVAFADLDRLLADCIGVMTVNSTVGTLALRIGKPVHALGDALYAMPGLAGSGDPDAFWTAPEPVGDGAYELFRRALFGECLVNAGLHSAEGLELLAARAAERMLERRP